jgi:hypothetical protein
MRYSYKRIFPALIVSALIAFCGQGYARFHVISDECHCCKDGISSKGSCCKKEKKDRQKGEHGNECGCITQNPESKQDKSDSARYFSFSTVFPKQVRIFSFSDQNLQGPLPLYRHSLPPVGFPRLTIPLLI